MGRFGKTRLTAEERENRKIRRHTTLRQIKGHYQHKQLLHGEFFHAGDQTLATFLSMINGRGTFLAACNERHAVRLSKADYKFIWHLERTPDPDDILMGKLFRKPEASGPLSSLKFSSPLAGAFVCERLHKQENVHDYLVSLRHAVAVDAPVAIVVPNVHHELVDDHLNLFTAGTLIYNMVRAGWNCKEATIYYDKRFLNILLRRRDVPEPFPQRVDDIRPYTPFKNVFNFCSSEFPEVYRA